MTASEHAGSLTQLPDTVLKTVERYQMLQGVSHLLVGFSGGVDSAVLLTVMDTICRERGIGLTAFHLHHGIRAQEADRDLEHCRAFCLARGISFAWEQIDVPAIAAREHTGLEETARRLRREALDTYAVSHGCERIATAHHADDALETMLFRLIRGSSLTGLCGIRPTSQNRIRPLIDLSKEEIVAWANRQNILYVTDSTNADPYYTRNYLRLEILPRLKQINPNAVQNARRTAQALIQDDSILQEMSESFDGTSNERLLVRRLLSFYYGQADAVPLERVHIEALLRLAQKGRCGQKIELPGVYLAVRAPNGIFFTKRSELDCPTYRFPLHEGQNELPSGNAVYYEVGEATEKKVAEKDKKPCTNIYKLSIQAKMDSAKISGRIFVSDPTAFDTLRYGGMTHKVKKLLQQAPLPTHERKKLPLFSDEDGALWIPFSAVADRVRVHDGKTEKSVVTLTYLYRSDGYFPLNTEI